MNLENTIFKATFDYRVKLVNDWIRIIKTTECQKREEAFKIVVFKMMKDIVKKNISNCLNLLNGAGKQDMPERDELISECYIIFDKCLSKYNIEKGNNFYFYYNKSISRHFFKYYQRECQSLSVELTDAISTTHPKLHCNSEPDLIEALMHHFHFTEIDKRITRSRLQDKKISEFLKENADVTCNQYSRSLQKIKETLNYYKETGEL